MCGVSNNFINVLRVFCNYVKCSARETPMVIKEMLETSLRFIAHCALVGK